MTSAVRASPLSRAAVWFAALGGAAAWVAQEGLSYSLHEAACARATASSGEILGTDIETVVLAIGVACGIVAVAATIAAIVSWRANRGGSDGAAARRAFIASTGVITGPLFLAVIAFGTIQLLWFSSCG